MSTQTLRVDFYRDAAKKWRWRARSNGHILADSGQGYSRRTDCVSGMCRVFGLKQVRWISENPHEKYGQAARLIDVVEVIVWKRIIDYRVTS